jgi:methyl-accepting chemotaxis protein
MRIVKNTSSATELTTTATELRKKAENLHNLIGFFRIAKKL